jgi:uncharacterized protein (DUF952 family)
VILHLVAEEVWRTLGPGDRYAPASLDTEGFVHCTADDDLLLRVANAFYVGDHRPMVVLGLDPDRLAGEVRWEAPPDGDPLATERFPHVYGPLEVDAVVQVRRLERDADGAYVGFSAFST